MSQASCAREGILCSVHNDLRKNCAGGFGLAAIQIATAAKAGVLATAGSVQKRTYLRQQGLATVVSSRTLDFAEHLGCLEGTRPTIVLNSLTSPGLWTIICASPHPPCPKECTKVKHSFWCNHGLIEATDMHNRDVLILVLHFIIACGLSRHGSSLPGSSQHGRVFCGGGQEGHLVPAACRPGAA